MDERLRKLQLTQLEILDEIDRVCRKNGIRYSLYAGTLLGAVRHRGFIPWDDDLDICMERSEYERFLKVWDEDHIQGYFLQNKDNTPAFPQSFTKIRKEHTTFIQDKSEFGAYHTGIFVDVFPIDRMPAGFIRRAFFIWNCLCYQLLCREFVPPKGSLFTKCIAGAVLLFSRKEGREAKRKRLLDKITSDCNILDNTVAIETVNSVLMPLPAGLLDDYIFLPFEDKEYMCFGQWHEYLTRKYGDYLTLPPDAERIWKHHPILIDFEYDYDELQQQGTIDRFS